MDAPRSSIKNLTCVLALGDARPFITSARVKFLSRFIIARVDCKFKINPRVFFFFSPRGQLKSISVRGSSRVNKVSTRDNRNDREINLQKEVSSFCEKGKKECRNFLRNWKANKILREKWGIENCIESSEKKREREREEKCKHAEMFAWN